MVLIIIYMILGYWAVGQTIYANKIRFGTYSNLLTQRIVTGFLFGFVLIPIAIIKVLFFRR
ncbi:hypothetical protein EDD66_10478 [Mobilisporobacter senegalensis]|uniref:Uncharacterized protein n=1 Tax=Mobilisporobacter senegalensis TaxID=1329262 RepID=A0A3N1XPE5_9FIRM|nr:hypothetical protein EDD66_10478 [Mobilisporobacter senegalensis]